METLRLNTVVFDDNAAAANDLARVTLTIDLAQTSPGTKDLGVSDLDQVNLVLGAESFNEFDVFGLGASLNENAKVGLTLIKGLGALTETTGKTIVD